MQVKIDKIFTIAATGDKAWAFLQYIEGVATCMPGAEITEKVDENNYLGKVKAKVGPASMAFNGTIEIRKLDTENRVLHMIGVGQDTKGTSSAEMDLTATVVDLDDGTCELKGIATVTVTGKMASLGGRMLTQVADQILNQFGKNFANNTIAIGGDEEDAEKAKERLAEQPEELNGLAFAWSIFKGTIKGLFNRSANSTS